MITSTVLAWLSFAGWASFILASMQRGQCLRVSPLPLVSPSLIHRQWTNLQHNRTRASPSKLEALFWFSAVCRSDERTRSALTLPPLVLERHVGQSDPAVYKPVCLLSLILFFLLSSFISFSHLLLTTSCFFSEIKRQFTAVEQQFSFLSTSAL